jgi:hypothetical protein
MTEKLLTAENIGLEKISPSMLNCYEECPRLFYYQNWLGLKLDEDKLHMDFGNAIHETIGYIHVMYDTNFGGGWIGQTFEQIEKYFSHKWTISKVPESTFEKYMQTKAGKESGFKDRKDLFKYFYNDGIAMLQSYWDNKERLLTEYNHDWSDFEQYMKIEMHNPENPSDKLPIPLSMRLDARNRTRTKIGDFKTSSSKYDEVETRKKIQGQCYLFANLMATNQMIKKFDYIVLRKGLKSADRIEVVQLEYDEADMVAFYFRVKNILLRIANREFDAPMVGHPPYCQCRKYEEALSVKDIIINHKKQKSYILKVNRPSTGEEIGAGER